MSNGLRIHVAHSDTGTRCCECGGGIKAGQEFYIEPWGNAQGFNHQHYECPKADNTGPRVVQGHDKRSTR